MSLQIPFKYRRKSLSISEGPSSPPPMWTPSSPSYSPPFSSYSPPQPSSPTYSFDHPFDRAHVYSSPPLVSGIYSRFYGIDERTPFRESSLKPASKKRPWSCTLPSFRASLHSDDERSLLSDNDAPEISDGANDPFSPGARLCATDDARVSGSRHFLLDGNEEDETSNFEIGSADCDARCTFFAISAERGRWKSGPRHFMFRPAAQTSAASHSVLISKEDVKREMLTPDIGQHDRDAVPTLTSDQDFRLHNTYPPAMPTPEASPMSPIRFSSPLPPSSPAQESSPTSPQPLLAFSSSNSVPRSNPSELAPLPDRISFPSPSSCLPEAESAHGDTTPLCPQNSDENSPTLHHSGISRLNDTGSPSQESCGEPCSLYSAPSPCLPSLISEALTDQNDPNIAENSQDPCPLPVSITLSAPDDASLVPECESSTPRITTNVSALESVPTPLIADAVEPEVLLPNLIDPTLTQPVASDPELITAEPSLIPTPNSGPDKEVKDQNDVDEGRDDSLVSSKDETRIKKYRRSDELKGEDGETTRRKKNKGKELGVLDERHANTAEQHDSGGKVKRKGVGAGDGGQPVRKKSRMSRNRRAYVEGKSEQSNGQKGGERRKVGREEKEQHHAVETGSAARKPKRKRDEAGKARPQPFVVSAPKTKTNAGAHASPTHDIDHPADLTNDSYQSSQPPQDESLDFPVPHGELVGMLIESMATSRASSLPASSVYRLVLQSRPAICALRTEQQWMEVFERVLEDGRDKSGVFGKVESSGKDDAGYPLEAQWFYVPERDEDQERATLIRSMMPRPAKRSETKKYKQYYYQPLDKISRWDPEDEL